MKPTKKVAAKRVTKKKPAKRAVRRGSIEHKLLQLYNRIDATQTINAKHGDLKWVWMKVEEVQNGVILGKGIMKRCNDMWRSYEGK